MFLNVLGSHLGTRVKWLGSNMTLVPNSIRRKSAYFVQGARVGLWGSIGPADLSADLCLWTSLPFAWNRGSGRSEWESNISLLFDVGQRTVPAALSFLLSACLSSDAVPPAVSWKLHDSGVPSCSFCRVYSFLGATLYDCASVS